MNLSTKSKTIERTESVLREECKICNNLIPINELRAHFTKCADSAISKSDNESSEISNDEERSTQRGPAVVSISISDQSSELLPSTVAVPELIGPFTANSNLAHSTPEAVELTNDGHFPDNGQASLSPSGGHDLMSVDTIAESTIKYCKENAIENPVEILRYLQGVLVTGRPLEVENDSQCSEGDTNFIMVNRYDVVDTAFPEIDSIDDLRKTLEVQFYGEVCFIPVIAMK